MPKYRNAKTEVEGIIFDSKKEARRYLQLKELERQGVITNLQRQIPFELVPKQTLPEPYMKGNKMHRTEHAIKYYADFVYIKDGKVVVEDTKGYKTKDYRMKYKLMLFRHGIQIKEV